MASENCYVDATKLEALLGESFFKACVIHENEKKNEKNRFCMDCTTSLCTHCVHSHHHAHHLLKIKRYMYEDVLGLEDAEELINCSFIQSYTTNSAKVVFLKHKNVEKQAKCSGKGNLCNVCGRSLQPPFLFCSISCKIGAYPIEERVSEKLHFASKTTYNHILKDSRRKVHNSMSNRNCNLIEISKKKRTPRCCGTPTFATTTEETIPMNRRKSTPHRSPMY